MSQEDDTKSFLLDCDENDDLQPHQLSGDQSAEKTVLLSDVTGKKANLLLTVTTIMKTVIGAGILSLPLTFSRLGYVLALMVFVFVIACIQFACILLLKSKNLSHHSNYSSIAYHIFRNKFMQTLCSLAILINNLGICIVELTIFKGSLRKIILSYLDDDNMWMADQFYTSTIFIVLILAVLQVPFTLVKKIQKLKFMAFLGVAGITVFVITLIVTFFAEMGDKDHNWQCNSDVTPFESDLLEMAAVIPNLMLAFGYHMNFFPIFKGLKDSKDQKMSKASIFGILGCAFFYFLVGNIGYCLFGRNVQGNFLLAFNRDKINDVLYILLNFGFLVSVFFSFPVMFFGARNNFIAISKTIILVIRKTKEGYRPVNKDAVEEISSYIQIQDRQQQKKKAKVLFYVYTFILYLIAIGVAIAVDDIEDVFSIVGSVAANGISFIFPALFYLTMVNRKKKQKNVKYYLAWAMFIFFIPFGIFAVISNFVVDVHHQ